MPDVEADEDGSFATFWGGEIGTGVLERLENMRAAREVREPFFFSVFGPAGGGTGAIGDGVCVRCILGAGSSTATRLLYQVADDPQYSIDPRIILRVVMERQTGPGTISAPRL